MKYKCISLLTVLSCAFCFGQEENFTPELKKYFLIAHSSKDYEAAWKKANTISEGLDLKLDLRELIKNDSDIGLTLQKSMCEGNGWGYPCYAARGRYDDGDYVSVEWSNAYEEFSEGYYIVIVSSQTVYDQKIKSLLDTVKEIVPSAYVKSSMIYMGCMH